MPNGDEQTPSTIGIVEWFDSDRGVGSIRPQDGGHPCTVSLETVRAAGLSALSPGDRVSFRLCEDKGERVAADLALMRAVQRWENEGGSVEPNVKPA
jgi:cold shock CspA family protein